MTTEKRYMKILSIERTGLHRIMYWMEDAGIYKHQAVSDDDQIEDFPSVPVSNYKNYEHFAGVMGKFNPETVFLVKPITIKKLDFETMLALCNKVEAMFRQDIKEVLARETKGEGNVS